MKKKIALLLIVVVVSAANFAGGYFLGKKNGEMVFVTKQVTFDKELNDILSKTFLDIQNNGEISYYHLYKYTLLYDYMALEAIKKEDCDFAKGYLKMTIDIKRSFPKLWRLHRNEKYPVDWSRPKDFDRLASDPDENGIEVIQILYDEADYYIMNNDFEQAILTINECVEYENTNNIGISMAGPYVSCVYDYEKFFWRIFEADCCGFLDVMNGDKISLEQKNEILNNLSKNINGKSYEWKDGNVRGADCKTGKRVAPYYLCPDTGKER